MPLTASPATLIDGRFLFAILFVFVFIGVLTFAILLANGAWRALARAYGTSGAFAGRRFTFQWTTRNGRALYKAATLSVGADAEGLRLDVTYMMVPLGQPLFIPWSDVTAAYKNAGWLTGEVVELTFARVPGVQLRIRGHLAEAL